ncbi:MAG: TetR/AcrR family transcriptional regulator, partial [Phycisphaeraceae bacterium]|nr:TetR/AcrR family transcriptional regulator [Phycisphaeraceae bacterium]
PAAAVQLSRQQILHATAGCLGEKGYDATTIRAIASRLGCAVGSIYRYYQDKRELLSFVTQSRLVAVAEQLEGKADLESALREYHAQASDDPAAYQLMFWLATVTPDGRPEAVATAGPGASKLPGVVVRIIDAWARRIGDLSLTRQAWGLLHGSILIGDPIDATLALLTQLGAVVSSTEQADAPAQPVIVARQPAAAPAGKSGVEDVCLL